MENTTARRRRKKRNTGGILVVSGQWLLKALLMICFLSNVALLSFLMMSDDGDGSHQASSGDASWYFGPKLRPACNRSRLLDSSSPKYPRGKSSSSSNNQTILRRSPSTKGGSNQTTASSSSCSGDDCYKAPKNHIAVCLQFKDDNNRLPEWIAYHYYALPMRHLSIMLDPNSFTSPQSIIDQWNGTDKMGMNIRIWKDEEVFSDQSYMGKLNFSTTSYEKLREMHRSRQRHFFRSCMLYYSKKYIMKEKESLLVNEENEKENVVRWVLLIDVDEYMIYNPIYPDEPHFKDNYKWDKTTNRYRLRKSPQLQLANDYSSEFYDDEKSILNSLLHRPSLPRIHEQKIADYIANHSDEHPWLKRLRPCKIYPRLTFGPQEEETTSRFLGNDLDQHFNVTHFDTLRYFHHGKKGYFDHNYYGKALVDVTSQRVREYLEKYDEITTVHLPLEQELCGEDPMGEYQNTSLFVINHYTGSKEAFFFKPDKRRTKARFEMRANFGNIHATNFDMKPWLAGFVTEVGLEKAKELLEKAGYLGNRDEIFPNVDYHGENDTRPDEHVRDDDEKEDDDDDNFISDGGREERNASLLLPRNVNNTTTFQTKQRVKNSVAVCLSCYHNDDARYISEWLAYHYTILPLRRLTIIFVDEANSDGKSMQTNNTSSKTATMTSIVEKWNGTMGMDIKILRTMTRDVGNETRIPSDTQEQIVQQQCLDSYLQKTNHDIHYVLTNLGVDDYFLYNSIHDTEKGYYFNFDFEEEEYARGKRGLLRVTNRARRTLLAASNSNNNHVKEAVLSELESRLHLPKISGTKSVTKYLHHQRNKAHWKMDDEAGLFVKPCRFLPRRVMYEDRKKTIENSPHGDDREPFSGEDSRLTDNFDPKHFRTLQFFNHNYEMASPQKRRSGQALFLDLKKIRKLLEKDNNITRLSSSSASYYSKIWCSNNNDTWQGENEISYSSFIIHHYVRQTTNESTLIFHHDGITNYDIKPWFHTFVQQVGVEKAKELLMA